MVLHKGQSEAVLLQFVAKIHASMLRVLYIGKCSSDGCRAVGTNGDTTWLPVDYQNRCLNLYVRLYFCVNSPGSLSVVL